MQAMPEQRKVSDFSTDTTKFHQPRNYRHCVKDLLSPHPNTVLAFRTFLFRSRPIAVADDDDLKAKIEFMRMVRSRFGEETETYQQFLQLLSMYKNGCDKDGALCAGIFRLFEGHADLQESFMRIVSGPGHRAEHEEDLSDFELQGLAFCDKLKKKLGQNCDDDEAYLRFLKMLSDHSTGFVELQMHVSDLVGDCPVIMKELANFLQAFEDSDQ